MNWLLNLYFRINHLPHLLPVTEPYWFAWWLRSEKLSIPWWFQRRHFEPTRPVLSVMWQLLMLPIRTKWLHADAKFKSDLRSVIPFPSSKGFSLGNKSSPMVHLRSLMGLGWCHRIWPRPLRSHRSSLPTNPNKWNPSRTFLSNIRFWQSSWTWWSYCWVFAPRKRYPFSSSQNLKAPRSSSRRCISVQVRKRFADFWRLR